MKVLSIKEPFASLVALGIKKIETRSWKTNYRGEIYIHASLTKNVIKDKKRKEKLLSLLPNNYDFKQGYIICKAYLKDCIYMDEEFINKIKKEKIEYLCGHYEIGRYAWVLENVELLDKVILAKGKLGIWYFNQEVNFS